MGLEAVHAGTTANPAVMRGLRVNKAIATCGSPRRDDVRAFYGIVIAMYYRDHRPRAISADATRFAKDYKNFGQCVKSQKQKNTDDSESNDRD